MKFAVFTASTPEWEPDQAARILAEQGWDGIEWRVTDQQSADPPGFWAGNRATWPLTGLEERLDDIRRIMADSRLAFSAIGGYVGSADHDGVERMLTATAALDAGQVRVTMPGRGDRNYRDVFSATRRDVEWIADRARAHGVKALIELHHRTITASASAAFRMVDGLDPASVGVIHDLGNLLVEGQEDHLSAFQLLGPYLAHVHVKNAIWRAVGTPSDEGEVEFADAWVGMRVGQADVRAYLRDLALVGYDGWVTAEDFSTDVPIEERTRDNLAYLRSAHAAAVATVSSGGAAG